MNRKHTFMFLIAFFLVCNSSYSFDLTKYSYKNEGMSNDKKSSYTQWDVVKGLDLRTTLYKWAKLEGWQLVWESNYKYEINASTTYQGTFTDAIEQLVDSLGKNGPQIYVTLYSKNKILRVTNEPEE